MVPYSVWVYYLNVKVTVKEGDDFKQVSSILVPQESLNDWQIVETEIEIGSATESILHHSN